MLYGSALDAAQSARRRGADGRVYVYVDASPDAVHEHDRGRRGDVIVDLVSELRDWVRFLERELERKDAILLNMTEAMKAIAPPEPRLAQEEEPPPTADVPREYAVTPTPQPGRVGPQTEVEAAQEPAGFPEIAADEQQGRGRPLCWRPAGGHRAPAGAAWVMVPAVRGVSGRGP